LKEGKYQSTIAAIASQAYTPKIGDKIETKMGGQMPGVVTKVTDTHVHFDHATARHNLNGKDMGPKKYKTSISNVKKMFAEMFANRTCSDKEEARRDKLYDKIRKRRELFKQGKLGPGQLRGLSRRQRERYDQIRKAKK
jgi:FKBP-type peptidyl-prolyl cis-trans isomerase 2